MRNALIIGIIALLGFFYLTKFRSPAPVAPSPTAGSVPSTVATSAAPDKVIVPKNWTFNGATDCAAVPFQGQTISIRSALILEGNNVVQAFHYYLGKSCADKFSVYRHEGTYEIEGRLSQAQDSPWKVVSTANAATLTPKSAVAVQVFNDPKNLKCGVSGWELNKPKDISGRKCDGIVFETKGMKGYDIFKLDGLRIYTGNRLGKNNGATEVERPTELLPTYYSATKEKLD